jgi:hypothetical protein
MGLSKGLKQKRLMLYDLRVALYILRVVLYVLRVHESPFFSKFAARNTPDNISPNLYNIFESSHHTLYLFFNLLHL